MRCLAPIALITATVAAAFAVEAVAAPPPLPWPDAAPAPAALSPEFAAAVMPPVVVSLPGMDRVGLRRNLAYSSEEDPNLRMDVYSPPGQKPGQLRPAVLFIHGGADPRAQGKDWGFYQSWGRLAAASELIGVTFTHRLSFPRTRVTEGAADVAAAIAYLRANAAELGVDPERLCLAAYSAGGPLLSPYMKGASAEVRCLVGYYPFMDIRQSEHHLAAESAETLAAFSPILQLAGPGRRTPMLLVRAGADSIPGLLDTVDRFAEAAIAADYPLTLINHPGATHGFDNKEPEPRSIEIVLATLAFLQHHLEAR